MASHNQWTEQDLVELIKDQVSESLTLDYKASAALQKSDSKKSELSKDVSAFANSAGGLLVYGIVENGHVPTYLDDGLDPTEISKEWIEHVLNSRIARRIDGLQIHAVPLLQHSPGRYAYVVSVPASSRAPHMASDHPVRSYKLEWRGAMRLPLMQGARYSLGMASMSTPGLEAAAYLFWEVLAPDSEPRRGTFRVFRINEVPTLNALDESWESSSPVLWRI